MVKNIVIMGAPGVGKGTLAKQIANEYHIPHISSGDMFRYAIKTKSKIGCLVENYINQGKLVPDDITIKVLEERLLQNDCKNGYILDGFPRTINQANALEQLTKKINSSVNVLINIKLDDKILLERIINRRICKNCETSYHLINKPPKKENVCDKCGCSLIKRTDDDENIFRDRLTFYYDYTKHLMEFYKSRDLLFIDLDGNQSIANIFESTVKKLNIGK